MGGGGDFDGFDGGAEDGKFCNVVLEISRFS